MDWQKLISRKRLRESKSPRLPSDKRSEFDNDHDRVVFSSSFRRLQDKTQVFPLESHDFIRTRLTHSSEVAAVGRSLGISAARILHDDGKIGGDFTRDWSTIIATACLLHDIGNPPFGHSGEKYIGSWFKQKLLPTEQPNSDVPQRSRGGARLQLNDNQERNDLTRFEGNAHAFRVATRLQTLGDEFGMNLTCGTLAALIKYPCASNESKKQEGKSRQKFGYFRSDSHAFVQVRGETGLPQFRRHPLTFLIEAADDIAYSVSDVEDALKKRVISFGLIESYLEQLPPEARGEYLEKTLKRRLGEGLGHIRSQNEREQMAFQNFRAYAIGHMTASCVDAFVRNYDAIMDGGFDQELTDVMDLSPLCGILKKIGAEHIYASSEVVKVEESGKQVVWRLLDIFYDELTYDPGSRLIKTLLPETPGNTGDNSISVSDDYRRAQRIADYIAGMTDTFLMSLHRRLTGIG